MLVRQRENPIVNRLNKTKVEKHPNLKQEKDDRLRDLRKKDQAAQQARVRLLFDFPSQLEDLLFSCRSHDRNLNLC